MFDPREILQRTLEANPNATIEELNAILESIVARHNLRPQIELGGLSPDVVHRLLMADWRGTDGAIRLNDSLSLAELGSAHALHRARLILEMVAERGTVKATTKGNLPRAFVTEFRERIASSPESDSPIDDAKDLNEQDFFPLHIPRILLEVCRIMKRRKGAFSLTERGEDLVGDEHAGELLTTLLHAHFRLLNLSYLDRAPAAREFQQSIAVTLYQFSRSPDEWRPPNALATALMLPSVREAIPTNQYVDMPALILETRFLRPLEGFGLAEVRRTREQRELRMKRPEYRRSPLFDRIVTFRLP